MSGDVLLISADLFLGSRVRGAAERDGHALDVAGSNAVAAEKLNRGGYRLVLIDLETPRIDLADLLAQRTNQRSAVFVAYGPHVRTSLLQQAREAGCDAVLTRGQFDASMGDSFTRYLRGDAAPDAAGEV